MSDAEIWNLKRGGHDYRKVYAAYAAATEHHGQPTVILAKTIKGYGLGAHFAGRNATHQMKKLTLDDLKAFRDSQRIPISDKQLEENPYLPPYYHPGEDAPEIRLHARAPARLGGALPARRVDGEAAGAARRQGLRGGPQGLGQAGGGHDDGLRPAAARAGEGQGDGRAVRADHPGRGAHVRDGLDVPDAEDLQPARPALHVGRRRPDARLQGERDRASCCTRASTRPARWARSSRRAARTPRTASR